MATKHTPATPLPWEAKFLPFAPPQTIGARAPNGSLDLVASLAESVAQGENRAQNATYIVAAANAYPRLVAALQDAEFLMRQAGKFPGTMQDSFQRSAGDASALLRELGE